MLEWEIKGFSFECSALPLYRFIFNFYFAETQFPCWKVLSCEIQAEQESRNWFALWNRQIHHKKKPQKNTIKKKIPFLQRHSRSKKSKVVVKRNLRRNGRWLCSFQLWYGFLRKRISLSCLLNQCCFPPTGVLN